VSNPIYAQQQKVKMGCMFQMTLVETLKPLRRTQVKNHCSSIRLNRFAFHEREEKANSVIRKKSETRVLSKPVGY